MFDKVNIHASTPHMLVFCKNGNYLVVLHYDEYHEDSDFYSRWRKVKYSL